MQVFCQVMLQGILSSKPSQTLFYVWLERQDILQLYVRLLKWTVVFAGEENLRQEQSLFK